MATPARSLDLAADFRSCQVTGYKVYRPVEKLVLFNAVNAVLALTLGGILALLIALTRWQAVQLLPMELYYRFLTAHGLSMLVLWIVFFEIAALQFGATVLLNARMPGVKFGWTYSVLMLIGAVVAEVTALSGKANVMFTAYPPMKAHPAFYLGIILFAVGALLGCLHFFYNIHTAKKEGVIKGNLPLVVYALLTATIIAIWTILHGAVAYGSAFLYSLGLLNIDTAAWRMFFWGFGHGAQQVNLAAMVACWYALASLTTGARPVHEGLCRFAFVLYLLAINLGSMHHLLVDPGPGVHARLVNTSYLMYAAVLGSLIHAFSIPAAIETAQRARGFTNGLFAWLKNAPWGTPGFAALVWSFVGFGFLAGVSGVLQGTAQLNMLVHNTLFVPGHFHATVVLGTTMAFMGLAYYVVPLIARKDLALPRVARLQPYVYGVGLLGLIGGLMLSGRLGAPRRVWDMGYSTSALPVDLFNSPIYGLTTGLLGLGALVAVTGGAMFVLVMVTTVFFGKQSEKPAVGLLAVTAGAGGPANIVPVPEHDHHKPGLVAPGTLTLTFIFLGWFVLAYLIAWVSLSRVGWLVG